MTTRQIAAVGLVAAAAGVGVAARVDQAATAPVACTTEAVQQRAPLGTVITGATVKTTKLDAQGNATAYCEVDGHVAVPGNTVNFRLGLPQTWNSKYYFQGVGGLGGAIGSLDTGLTRGYASASTDTGHVASNPTWMSNRAKEIDYGHRGTHATAVAGKALTAAFYGQAPQHAYFNGCSNGGRQALMEVQRYPDDFDGIIAGDPATGTPMQVGRAVVYQTMLTSKDAYLTAEKIELIGRATLAACDHTDGLKDGLVSDPRTCTFAVDTLACTTGNPTDCLTAGQLASARQIYAGVKTADGRTYAHGFPPGHEGGASGWRQWISGAVPPETAAAGTLEYQGTLPAGYALMASNFSQLALDVDDARFNWRVFNIGRDLPRMQVMTDILSPRDPDLRPYKQRGGKLIVYHAWSDPGISAYGTVDYNAQMVARVGGQAEADTFSRLYMVPGMHHCSGGPGPNSFDMLPVLEAWVERGVAPQAVVASHTTAGKVDRTRPLCPHPQVARYAGQGSVDEAASFRCVAP